jgi:hypothetical protein
LKFSAFGNTTLKIYTKGGIMAGELICAFIGAIVIFLSDKNYYLTDKTNIIYKNK